MDSVVVLGAGLAGLGFARTLPGVRVLEAADHPGGRASSRCIDGVFFDQGVHVCHSEDPGFVELAYHSAGDVHRVDQSQVMNHWRGTWIAHPVQNHLHALPLKARSAALADFLLARARHGVAPSPGSDYLQWCTSQYGEYITRNFYKQYTAKYWRVPMEELSTDWLGGRVLPSMIRRVVEGALRGQKEDQTKFARFHYPMRGGFFAFFQRLYDDLEIRYNARAVQIDPFRRIVQLSDGREEHYEALASSIPLPDLVEMIKDAPSSVREAAARLRHTQLLCVDMIIDRPHPRGVHWYYIYDDDIDASRVTIMSNLAPTREAARQTWLQAEVFRRADERFNVDAVVEQTVRDLARLFDFHPSELRWAAPNHVPHAYVISDRDRASLVEGILDWLRVREIIGMGLYGTWRYMWSDAAFRSGEQCARAVRERFEAGEKAPIREVSRDHARCPGEMAELCVIFRHHLHDEVTVHNFEALKEHNPGYPIIPIHDGVPEHLPGSIDVSKFDNPWPNHDPWQSCDTGLYRWFLNREISAKRYVFLEYDCLCTTDLYEVYKGIWDVDIAGRDYYLPGQQRDTINGRYVNREWAHFGRIHTLDPSDRPFAAGIAPFAATFYSHHGLVAIVENVSRNDVFSELRVGTAARKAGLKPATFPEPLRSTVLWDRCDVDTSVPGLYHPIKQVPASARSPHRTKS
jgi:protoporphyrinogen oxidase